MNPFEILVCVFVLVVALDSFWKIFGNDITRWYIDRKIDKLGKDIEEFRKNNPSNK